MRSRELHAHIRAKILLAKGDRSWNQLAKDAGVPHSTLATQAARPRFSLDVLLRLAGALDREPSYFLPVPIQTPSRASPEADALAHIRMILDRVSEPAE